MPGILDSIALERVQSRKIPGLEVAEKRIPAPPVITGTCVERHISPFEGGRSIFGGKFRRDGVKPFALRLLSTPSLGKGVPQLDLHGRISSLDGAVRVFPVSQLNRGTHWPMRQAESSKGRGRNQAEKE